jgi:hypothetical protein
LTAWTVKVYNCLLASPVTVVLVLPPLAEMAVTVDPLALWARIV